MEWTKTATTARSAIIGPHQSRQLGLQLISSINIGRSAGTNGPLWPNTLRHGLTIHLWKFSHSGSSDGRHLILAPILTTLSDNAEGARHAVVEGIPRHATAVRDAVHSMHELPRSDLTNKRQTLLTQRDMSRCCHISGGSISLLRLEAKYRYARPSQVATQAASVASIAATRRWSHSKGSVFPLLHYRLLLQQSVRESAALHQHGCALP